MLRFPAERLDRDRGLPTARGWAGELPGAAGYQCDQNVPKSDVELVLKRGEALSSRGATFCDTMMHSEVTNGKRSPFVRDVILRVLMECH